MRYSRTVLTKWWCIVVAWVALVGASRPAFADVSVVATTPDLAAIARQIGGPSVKVQALALATQDPHFVDAKPSLALVLNRADLILVQGLDLEIGWLGTLLAGARNPKIQNGADGYLDCSTAVSVLDVPTAPLSRAQGDIHRGGNPHYLYDPRNGARVARAIAERLSRLDGANAPTYEANATAFERAATELAESTRAKFEKLSAAQRKIVVYHRSWIYLEQWLGLTEVGAVEPKPGIPPDPGHVASLLGIMRAQGVRAILAEEFYPETTAKLLAEKSKGVLLRMPGGTDPTQSYLDHLRLLANRTFEALSR